MSPPAHSGESRDGQRYISETELYIINYYNHLCLVHRQARRALSAGAYHVDGEPFPTTSSTRGRQDISLLLPQYSVPTTEYFYFQQCVLLPPNQHDNQRCFHRKSRREKQRRSSSFGTLYWQFMNPTCENLGQVPKATPPHTGNVIQNGLCYYMLRFG